jgi:chorismate mutase/prephenate dehydratase
LPRVEIVETSSNARSAELAAKEKHAAALGGILAADKYGLRILEQDIQDNAANATRFLVLGRQCSPPTGDDRTSLMVSVADKSGRPAPGYRRLPPFQDQHDQDRIPAQQTEGLGIFFLH